MNKEKIIQELVDRGWSKEIATEYVNLESVWMPSILYQKNGDGIIFCVNAEKKSL